MKKLLPNILLFVLLSVQGFAQANWSAVLPNLFPTNASGQIHGISRVSQMKFHPTNPNKMYAISARGGLFISTDAGANWTVAPGTDFMPYARMASVCIDYTNDQILYLGTGDHNYYYTGSGIWKSTDGGTTFTQTGLSNLLVLEILMDPADHNILVAATNAGIYKSTNAGVSWVLKTSSRPFDDLKMKEHTGTRTLFAATTDSAFFRSTDFGDTWTQITAGITLPSGVTNGNGCRIGLTPADSNVVYFSMVANGGMVYKSTNGGTSFTGQKTASSPYIAYYTNSSASSGQGDYNHGFGVDRTNPNIVWYVAHAVWKSTDGGINWTQQTDWWAKVHTDMHQITENPYNSSQLYNMNDGGVWLSTDGGTTWNPKSDGMFGYEIYHGNCSPTRRDMISIGTQDNGELYANSTGWFTNRGGDWGSQCAFDYRSNSSMVYYYGSNKRRLVNGGESTYGLPSNVTVLQDIAFHRSNPDLAFVADTVILRTTNLTAATPTWTQIAGLGKKIMAMHCSFADPNRLYVITADAMIYVSTNALSATPTFTSYTLPNSTNNSADITSIKNSPNTIYITCNTKAYRSTDNGATWVNITYNLPSTNHTNIIADEYSSSNELVFLATNNTVYYKLVSASTWTIFNANLPSRPTVIDMSIYNDSTSNTVLRLANYGRGVWETPINNLRALKANFTVDNGYPCPGNSVQFSDLSTGTITSYSWSFPGGTPSTSTASNPAVTYSTTGNYTVTLVVTGPSGTSTEVKTNYISTRGINLPLSENFESGTYPPVSWSEYDDGSDGIKWQLSSSASGFGTGTNSIMFDNWNNNTNGKKDEIRTARIDGNNYASLALTFDVAYWEYNNSAYKDTLQVLISTDCGSTFTPLYTKGGAVLSTVPGQSSSSFIPTSSQWRKDTILLNSYIGQSFILAFRNIGRYGNNLFLDNIAVNATVSANAGPDQSVCLGSSAGIGSSAVAGYNYSWSPTTGLSSSTVSNPTVTPTVNTSYILTVSNSISGISGNDTVNVIVTPNSATITPGSIASSLCTSSNYVIPFTVNCNFYSGNIFTVQLSDASGSFASPVSIGTLTSIGAGTINVTIPSSTPAGSNYRIRIVSSNPATTGADNGTNISIATCFYPFNVKVLIQGFYKATGGMRAVLNPTGSPLIADSITIELHSASAPYSTVATVKGTMLISGVTQLQFPATTLGQSLYIVVKHRNSLETWSANPVSLLSGSTYDFSNAITKAFGSNMIFLGGTSYGIFSGDISNGITTGAQDGAINLSDYNALQSNLPSLLTGYSILDLSGDQAVESGDYSLMENNMMIAPSVKKP